MKSFAALITAFLLALTFLTVPRIPLTNGMESSWSAVLDYAHQKGLQFGTDVVYTYGPLGFLSIFYYTPAMGGLRLALDVALCFGVAAGLCLLAWRLTPGWRVLTIGIFTLFAANHAQHRLAVLGAPLYLRVRPASEDLCAMPGAAGGLLRAH